MNKTYALTYVVYQSSLGTLKEQVLWWLQNFRLEAKRGDKLNKYLKFLNFTSLYNIVVIFKKRK